MAKVKWISVKKRMPEDGEDVIAVVYGCPERLVQFEGEYQFATYYAEYGWFIDEYPEWRDAKVTHWMPLPEPPKEG